MVFTKEDILNYIPHRDPFLFIDGVEVIKGASGNYPEAKNIAPKELVGSEVVAHYKTIPEHAIFAGHFPGNPILPGVVQVEMMAQATSFIYALTTDTPSDLNFDVALVSISNAKFRRPVLPNMDLRIETHCTKVRGPMIENDCKIFNGDTLMSEATVMASVRV